MPQALAGCKKKTMSKMRRSYMVRLVLRCLIFVACVLMYIFRPEWMRILEGDRFFRELSPLHLLWAVWVVSMVLQLVPMKKFIPLGSQKHTKLRFRPMGEQPDVQALRAYTRSAAKEAYKVFGIWAALTALLGALYLFGILKTEHLFLVSVAFYVCDLICVLIWCPFRLLMGTRCCTSCRIFNWDHLMMFTPMLLVGSFFSVTLVGLAFVVWLVWELCVLLHPERFWEQTNKALRCSQCTDKLCSQYCGKMRK